MYVSKQQVLAAQDRVTEDVPVPEWAPEGVDPATCFVRVRSMTAMQRDAFEASMLTGGLNGSARKPNLVNMRARFCVMVIVDEQGSRVWNDNEAELLGDKNAAALDRVYTVGQRLSSGSDDAVKAIAKNSSAAQSDASPSTSA